jgi:hypothetical protein
MPSLGVASRAERLVYRIAGLPVALSGLLLGSSSGDPADPLQAAFVWRYWHPIGAGEWSELLGGLIAWPVALVVGSLWFTIRNGRRIRQRSGKTIHAQFLDQLRLYFSDGVLAPWYYIFSLYEDGGRERARGYLQRFETKPCLFLLLKRRRGSPLTDKKRFAEYCATRGVRCVENLMHFDGRSPPRGLPERNLFVKPTKGRGGKGAERWDKVGRGIFSAPNGEHCTGDELLATLVERSRREPLVVQPRLEPHRDLAAVTAGALPTVRIVTCLNEHGDPEVIGAVFRMSIGRNVTVDNFHAGGIAANVELDTGRLSRATNMGSDARLGWLSSHPDTGAKIEGRPLPLWADAKALAIAAHRHFDDRVVVGWDIAILDDGPIVIEGNGNPDLDILQRFMRTGFRHQRFGELLGHHLKDCVPQVPDGFAREAFRP